MREGVGSLAEVEQHDVLVTLTVLVLAQGLDDGVNVPVEGEMKGMKRTSGIRTRAGGTRPSDVWRSAKRKIEIDENLETMYVTFFGGSFFLGFGRATKKTRVGAEGERR